MTMYESEPKSLRAKVNNRHITAGITYDAIVWICNGVVHVFFRDRLGKNTFLTYHGMSEYLEDFEEVE